MNLRRCACLCIVASLLMIEACSTSTAPTSATTTTTPTTSLITPATAALTIGQTQVYSYSTATSANTITWTSSNAAVLTIDGTGLATALASGVATITGALDTGTSSTLTVQVVPNYQGSWAGTAKVIACTSVDGFASAGYCPQIANSVQQWTLTLTQTGLTLSGTMTKSEGANVLNGAVTATIGGQGDIVSMTGALGGVANGVNLLVTPIAWDSFASGSSMSGSWSANVTSSQLTGSATVQWLLTGSGHLSASGSRGVPGARPAQLTQRLSGR
jgi:hypothetical protein